MTSSCTEVFYALLDLDEAQQKHVLDMLKVNQPVVYKQVAALLDADGTNSNDISSLFEKTASDVFDESDLTGLTFGKYEVTEKIGQGGIGMVYAAKRQDETYQQELAIKFIQPALTKVLGHQALYQEAQLLARLNHPYIAKVFDAGEHQDFVYMVMEKVNGTTLKQYVENQSLKITAILQLFSKICDAIEHGHQNQVIHADIKPENVMIDERGHPKIIDFNITQRQHSLNYVASAIKAYSVAFASPEQQRGDHLTQQSDVFSLGRLLEAMLSNIATSTELKLIIDHATQSSPRQRYKSVTALRLDIANHLAFRPLSVNTPTPWYVFKKLAQRRPLPMILVFALLVSGISFTTLLMIQNQQLKTEQALTQDMVLELTDIVFHRKSTNKLVDIDNMLELSRRRIIANQNLPTNLKKKMLMAMMQPVPDKAIVHIDCQSDCLGSNQ